MNAAYSVPAWTDKRAGTLLVVGSAPCLFEDVERARALRMHADTLLINEAAGAIEDAQHVLAGHGDKADLFMAYRREKFPDAPPVFVHASLRSDRPLGRSVTHVWHHVATGGTSAWKAVRIGKAMGYGEIILCGCPMVASGYFNNAETGKFKHDCARFGYGEGRQYDNYRRTFEVRARTEGVGVYSMSGWSRELLGEPPMAVAA